MPVGSVITWPSSNLPEWMTHGDYLECNGQTFDTKKYPRLYKALGTNHVPDYRGLFLRGYGSQNFTQNNGAIFGYTTVTYASGNMNEIQGDAMRRIFGKTMGAVQFRPSTSWNPDANAYGAVWTNAPDLNHFGYNVPSYDSQYGGGETRIPPSWFVPYGSGGYGGSFIFMDSERITPIANENRPINMAVRYFIKAK